MTEEVKFMKSDSGLAEYAVQALEEGHLEVMEQLMQELSGLHSPNGVTRLLAAAGAGLAYLRQAARAATEGDTEACKRFYRCALRYISEDEALALKEEHRLSFTVLSSARVLAPRVVLGFACH
ncbi:hypothetical protein KW794_01005 [Candidatus Saccharibacteria bacterium]|nr:hypothetical protein [Candidatus Saccharibacteria bacterium]